MSREFKRYALTRWLVRLLTASVGLHVITLLFLFAIGWRAGIRPTMQLSAAPSLKAEASELFGKDTEISVDDLYLYLNTVLPLMHRLDDRGASDLPLLRGLISPQEYERAQAEAVKSAKLAAKNFVVQNLVVVKVDDVVVDKERARLSAYVSGYLAIIIQATGKNVVMPYRAEVLLQMTPPGRLNRFPFMLLRRDWKIDKAAVEWDAVRKASSPAAAHDAAPATNNSPKQ